MSTFGWSNISGIDNDSAATPGGIDGSVQFNDDGINFAGVSDFTYNDVTKTLNVVNIAATSIISPNISAAGSNTNVQYNKAGILAGDIGFQYDDAGQLASVTNINTNNITPGTITDRSFQIGTAGQLLSSNGDPSVNLEWIDILPAGASSQVQFNDMGSFAGDPGFTFDNSTNELTVTAGVRTNKIIDFNNTQGTVNQLLTSDGTNSIWQNPQYVPGAPNNSIQFNNNSFFGGSANFVRNPTTGDVNINANLGVGSLTAPTDRLVVSGANSTIKVKSTGTNSGFLVLEDSSGNVKQLQMAVQADTADFTSIQQGIGFRNFRFNPTNNLSCIGIGTTGAQAIGGVMCSNALSNRKIILNSLANDEHQNISLGVNNSGTAASNTLRFQLGATTNFYTWNAATASNASNELMRLTGTGELSISPQSTSNLTISKAALGSAAPITVPTGTYLKIGGSEFRSGTSNPNYRLIGFGYNTGTNNQPAYMGYVETNGSGDSLGALIFGTRNATTGDVIPTERMRISANGNVGIGTSTPGFPLQVTGQIYCDILYSTNRVIPTQIQDGAGLPSTGTSGQYLAATGTGILWTNRPLPYAETQSSFGAFSTTAPVPASGATVVLQTIRSGRYKLTTNIVAFPTASNVTVTVEIYTRQVVGGAWTLLYNTQTFMNTLNIHLPFPAKSSYISCSAGFLEVFVRTGANTGSNASDVVNIDILECNTL
jgi:hypothetical protein